MVTTMRSSGTLNNVYEKGVRGGTSVMDKPLTYENFNKPAETEDIEQAKARMQKNLDRILNYERYTTTEDSVETVTATETVEKTEDKVSEEDITPTSTTMQFGDDIDQIRKEMNKVAETEDASYRLNKKGKVAVILYSLIVTVVLALIVLNTGILASLNNSTKEKTALLQGCIDNYNSVQSEIESISNSDYIANMAENEFGMVRR